MANHLGRLNTKGTNILGVSKPREPINSIRGNQTPGNILGNTLANNLQMPSSGNRDPFPYDRAPSLTSPIPLGNLFPQEPEEDPNDPMQLYDAYASKLEGMSAAQRAAAEARYKETLGLLNNNYDRNANYAYINYRQGQRELPEELSNMGVTGGASESANIKLQNAYGQNLANNEFSRGNDLTKARSNYNEALSGVDANLNAQLADAYANFAQQSQVYNQEKKAKAEAEAKSKALATKNNDTYSRMAARIKQGYDVTTWTDEQGYFHYRLNGNTKKTAEKSAKALASAWSAAQNQMLNLANQGFTATIKTDSNGVPYAIPTGKKKLSSSGGGSTRKSGGGSSGGGSYIPAVDSKSNGGSSGKEKPTINYSQATSYFGRNAAKILSDPESVVKDLDKQVKSGKMNEITADYIYTKFPRPKKKGKRKKKG